VSRLPAACGDLAAAARAGWPGISGPATAVLAVSAACSGWEARGMACGTWKVVRTVAPMTAAATAWKGAMTGSRGAGRPARAAIASMSTATAASAHSTQTAKASPLMMAPSLSGLVRNACSCAQEGRWRGTGQPVRRTSAYGGPASTAAMTASPADARARCPGRPGRGVTGVPR
jgi:hypothetical protein